MLIKSSIVIGEKVTDDTLLTIRDTERRSGLYILGNPRVGKSWLMLKMMLQNIENEHRTDSKVIVLDPVDERYCFGVNRLACPDIDRMVARSHTFTKVKGVFDKLWKNSFEETPWLQLILQNTLYAFIENPGVTLLELPIFFYNTDLRHK